MPGSALIGTAYMFIPALAAVVVQKFVYREPVKEPPGDFLQTDGLFCYDRFLAGRP